MPDISGNKFLVVGGASLAGSHIAEQLLQAGAKEVVLADNLSLGSSESIDFLLTNPRCRFVRCDMLRLNELFDAMQDAAGVFVVAGFLAAPLNASPWVALEVNIRGVQNTMEAARYCGVKKVVFSSSVGVYGAGGAELKDEFAPMHWEGMPPSVVLYCASKIMGEGIGRMYKEKHDIDFVALRYSSIYGERQHKRAINANIVDAYQSIRSGRRPILQGNGSSVQDYVYVGDVARANLLAMRSEASNVGVNIVAGVDTPLNDVVRLIATACNAPFDPEYQAPTGSKMQTAPKLEYSRQRARDLIGWEPTVSLDEGISRLVKWLDGQRES